MANMNKLFQRVLPLLHIINSGVNDMTTLKSRYKQLCDKDWSSHYALDKAFIRDIRVLVVAGLIEKYQTTLTKTSRLKRVFQLRKNLDEKYELLKIYISTAHTNLLDGEHQSIIDENMLMLDRLILEANEFKTQIAA